MEKSQIELALVERMIVSMLGGMISTHSVDAVISIIDNLTKQREMIKAYFEATQPMIPKLQKELEEIKDQAEFSARGEMDSPDDFYSSIFQSSKSRHRR